MNGAHTRRDRSSGAKGDFDLGRRRVPYALRACDACRKRKGKCCGRHPCEYCVSRNQTCHFSPHANHYRPDAAPNNIDSRSQITRSWAPEALSSLGELVANLQGQIDSLKAQVGQVKEVSIPGNASSSASSNTLVQPPTNDPSNANPEVSKGTSRANQDPSPLPAEDPSQNSFYGPTSPDFSLNVAQVRLRQGSASKRTLESMNLAGISETQTDEEDDAIEVGQMKVNPLQTKVTSPAACQRLLQFRNSFNVREAVRLLLVYHEVVSEYHPILDIDMLVKQVEWWYTWPSSQPPSGLSRIDEHSALVANLAMATALCIESTSFNSEDSPIGDEIYANCLDLINMELLSPSPCIKHVITMLLVGIYHFYKDVLPFAWRMCGLAGRTLMELGLHNTEVSRHRLNTEQQWDEYVVIMSSIVVLDQQWSAATGLPTHFTRSDFNHELRPSNPYLRAMMAFVLISDKFNEPSSRVANGGAYEDDDEFDIMNFQIEQWRKKAVGNYNFDRILTGQPPSAFPPVWAILLNLRANAVRELLLRPFFFSNTPTTASRRNIQPSLDLITDTIDALSVIDRTTDIYRRHRPCFQHVLKTSCALMFLIVAYVEQNRASLSTDLPDNFPQLIARNLRNALSLAGAYIKSSPASRRLWKRLRLMKKLLAEAGVLHIENLTGDERPQASYSIPPQPAGADVAFPIARNSSTVRDARGARINDPLPAPTLIDLGYPFSADSSSPSDSIPAPMPHELSMDWMTSLSEDWALNNTNGLFWGT
ncbi:hypothetical protein F5884DRAFT_686095 [Xylogone sp. PMI_703]|nr:hypothetical protein F5884DRAFT_686095 [Xylogone sp. PMI_703]